jgi:hypothetical protein
LSEEDSITINGEPIPVDTVDGKRQLSTAWSRNTMIGGKPVPIYKNRPVTLEIKDIKTGDIVKNLKKWYGYKIPSKIDEDGRFIAVVEAVSEIRSGTGRRTPEGALDIVNIPKGEKGYLASPDTVNKFLQIGQVVGLWRSKKRGGTVGGKVREPKKESKIEKKKTDFQQNEFVQKLIKSGKYKKNMQKINHLQKALYVLDLSPYELLRGAFVDDDGEETGEFVEQGDFDGFAEWVSQMANRKSWTDEDGKKWSLLEWALAKSPPVWAGEGNKFSTKGQRISEEQKASFVEGSQSVKKNFVIALKHFLVVNQKLQAGRYPSGSFWSIPTPELKHDKIHMTGKEIQSMHDCLNDQNPPLDFEEEDEKQKEKVLGIPVITYEKWLKEQKRKDSRFPRIDDKNPKIRARHQAYVKKAQEVEGKNLVTKWHTTLQDWQDAFFYFILAVDFGWRANEAFTCTTSQSEEDREAPKKSAIWMDGDFMNIKFLTRKTWQISEDKQIQRYSHIAQVIDGEVIAYVNKRIAQVNEGLKSDIKDDDELYERYRIRKWKEVDGQREPNETHALIGGDGQYIKLGTMEFPSEWRVTEKEKAAHKGTRPVMKDEYHQRVLRAIMRVCYKRTIVDRQMKKYWKTNSLHALRHVFAQAWLIKSNGDFAFVAERGHWGGIDILEKAYGGKTDTQMLRDTMKYSNRSLIEMDKESEMEFTESQKKIAKLGMEQKDIVTANYRKEHPKLSEGAETVKVEDEDEELPEEKLEIDDDEVTDDDFEEEVKK